MRRLSLLLLLLALCGCQKDPISSVATNNPNFKPEFLFEVDGCKVYRFEDGNTLVSYRTIYLTTCAGNVQYSYQTRAGKSSTTHYVDSITGVAVPPETDK